MAVNRGHWSIASVHYIIDWNYDEDRGRIRTGFGPEYKTRLRRLAVGILKSFQKPSHSIAEMMRKLSFRTRLVFDHLRTMRTNVLRECPAHGLNTQAAMATGATALAACARKYTP